MVAGSKSRWGTVRTGWPACISEQMVRAHWPLPIGMCRLLRTSVPSGFGQAIVVEMKKLAGRRAALLLVTGLREAVCPDGSYWTQARQAQYDRVRSWIDQLACAWATRGSRLQVVVL